MFVEDRHPHPVCKTPPHIKKLDDKIVFHNKMLLDLGLASTKVTDEDYDEPNELLFPYVDENFNDLETIVEEDLEDESYNETSVNFNSEVSKIAINDILNEMRMGSPIENDLLSDLLSDDTPNHFYQLENGSAEGSNFNPNESYNYDFNQNIDFREQNTESTADDSNLLDQLLYPESCSIPDVQVEFNDGVPFQYDASDQFNCEPDIILSYPEELDETSVIDKNSNVLNFEANFETNFGNHCDPSNQMNYELNPYFNEAGNTTISNNPYFECSTSLPMTPEELQSDIEKYLNSEQNNHCASFYEYPEEITDNKGDDTFNFPYNTEMLQEYTNDPNQLLFNPINLTESFESSKIGSTEEYAVYQCRMCSYFTETLHGLNEHMRIHSDEHLNCIECQFSTTRVYHQNHESDQSNAYNCQFCGFLTHSSSKMRSHMSREH